MERTSGHHVSEASASKNPVRAAFKLIQQSWEEDIEVQAFDEQDRPVKFRFRYLDIVGNGTFGIVCRARCLDDGRLCAIKTVYQDEGHQNRELAIIKSLEHPNVVRMTRYFYTVNERGEEFLSLVLEYLPSSMDKLLKEAERKKTPLGHELIRQCMREFIRSLEYLHGLGICHRDIKPHNVLVDPEAGLAKLCDFGCSKRLVEGEPNIQYICARYYRAPEIVFSWAYYTCAIDMWSVGCVMAELFTGRPLFPGKNSVDQLARIVKVLGPPTPEDLLAMGQPARKATISSKAPLTPIQQRRLLEENLGALGIPVSAVDLLAELLRYDPGKRLTAIEALAHPFFTSPTQPAGVADTVDPESAVSSEAKRQFKGGFQPS